MCAETVRRWCSVCSAVIASHYDNEENEHLHLGKKRVCVCVWAGGCLSLIKGGRPACCLSLCLFFAYHRSIHKVSTAAQSATRAWFSLLMTSLHQPTPSCLLCHLDFITAQQTGAEKKRGHGLRGVSSYSTAVAGRAASQGASFPTLKTSATNQAKRCSFPRSLQQSEE